MYGLLSFQDPAASVGRYHRAGDPGTWYSSTTSRAAWAEFLRRHPAEIDPFEATIRMGRSRIRSLEVVDLSDEDTRRALGVTEADLKSTALDRCQEIGQKARAAGFEGIYAPSAALDGEYVVVVFKHGIPKVAEESSRVLRPPKSMKKYLRRIQRRTP